MTLQQQQKLYTRCAACGYMKFYCSKKGCTPERPKRVPNGRGTWMSWGEGQLLRELQVKGDLPR